MKEHTEVPQDPYADGITNPIRETPVDVGAAPAFPPNQDSNSFDDGVADATAASGGPIAEGFRDPRHDC
jgi:hypothetical protein